MNRKPDRILVTGATGFVGGYLACALEEEGRDWHGTSTREQASDRLHRVDLRDPEGTREIVARLDPDAVVHLAGVTYLPEVAADPVASFAVNVLGTLNLLEAVADEAPQARVLLVSTCVVYGTPEPGDIPLVETAPLRAFHPYGTQKIGLELLGERFRKARDLDVRIVRPFNHLGPGQDVRISVNYFANRIAAIERGEIEPVLRVGNLEPRRDFLDVRDVVRAYRLLLDHEDPPSPVNVARGVSMPMKEVLETLISQATRPIEVETDPARFRKADIMDLAGNAGRLRTATGWEPRVPLSETFSAVMEHARAVAEPLP